MRRRPLFPLLLVFFFVGATMHTQSSSATIIIIVVLFCACLVLRVPIVSSLGGVSFLVKSPWGMYWTRNDADEKRTRRQRRKEPTTTKNKTTKKNQQPTKKRLRRNRSLRAYRNIHTNMYIYIYFFFYETNRQSKERSSRLGSGRSIRIGFR